MREERLVGGKGTPVVRLAPEPGVPVRGGVVMVSEVSGIDAVLRDYAGRLVERGFVVAMPDLWWRAGGPPPLGTREEISAAVARLVDPEALSDVAVARKLLGAPGRAFVLGFCVGGLYARMAACAMMGFSGAVEFYGRIVYPTIGPAKPVQPLDLLPGLGCPIQCHFGTDDPIAPPEHVAELEGRLRGRPLATQVFRYPGCGHAFLNPGRPGWNPEAAALAWARAVNFLEMLADG